jgi:hypothetical protein
LLAAACSAGQAARVPDDVAESLPRQTRIVLRDAEQEVVIAQADLDQQRESAATRARELDVARKARGGPLRDAEEALGKLRLSVAQAEVDQATTRLDLARARRDQTHAEVLLRYELGSSEAVDLPGRRDRVRQLTAQVDEQIAGGRKLRADLDRVARKRDELFDRHLAQNVGRAGPPWTD